MPLPMTRDITRMYALDHEMFLPYVAVSGMVSCSTERSGASGQIVSDEGVDDGESKGVFSDDSMSDIFGSPTQVVMKNELLCLPDN